MKKTEFQAKGEVVQVFYQELPEKKASRGIVKLKLQGTGDILSFSLYETENTPSRFQYIRKNLVENNGNELQPGDEVEIDFFINQAEKATYLNVTSIHNIKKKKDVF